jgi:hypothetical protein
MDLDTDTPDGVGSAAPIARVDRTEATSAAYWDGVLRDWESSVAHRLWRAHSDAINVRLLRRWLRPGAATLLKTDLFDEAVGAGLYPELTTKADQVIGVDLSSAVVHAAVARYPSLDACVADVLALPFADASFEAVVSNSTLDHFESRAGLRAAITELARLTARRGELLITLDNLANPIVALRTSRLFGPLHRMGVVPYYLGSTCGAIGLARLLGDAGFEVRELTAIMHCPPQLAAEIAARGSGRRDGPAELEEQVTNRHLSRVLRFEAFERWPTRHLTGHFVAARATKR